MSKLISFELKQKDYLKEGCQHKSLLIDKALWYVECKKCGEKVNPIYWLAEIANKELGLEWRIDELTKKYNTFKEKFRRKCEHCGKFNTIRK